MAHPPQLGFLQYGFMQYALLAALLVGVTAPAVGTHLVQRRLSLIGDGMGHLALTGVALGILTGREPVLVALAATVVGAVAVELVRARGRTSADMALALLFYGGIAGGVVLISVSPGGTPANLTSFLFGAITTTTGSDLVVFSCLAAALLTVLGWLSPRLFAVSNDEEYARASGLPVLGLNLLLAVCTAVTIIVAMRIVGLLLVSALMVVPNITAQLVGRSFRATSRIAVGIGVAAAVGGVVVSFLLDIPSGGTIVLLTIAIFLAVLAGSGLRTALRRRRHPTPRDGTGYGGRDTVPEPVTDQGAPR